LLARPDGGFVEVRRIKGREPAGRCAGASISLAMTLGLLAVSAPATRSWQLRSGVIGDLMERDAARRPAS
jgi:hypothetical protein